MCVLVTLCRINVEENIGIDEMKAIVNSFGWLAQSWVGYDDGLFSFCTRTMNTESI